MSDSDHRFAETHLKQKTSSARLEWRENGQPVSTQYDDIYFSTQSGLEETSHTFILPNRLPERFARLSSGDCFTIAETGFGTGLNFLCVWQLFDALANENARLHFVSTEKHPLKKADFQRVQKLWPQLRQQASELLDSYMPACQGQQHFIFADGRVRLTLLIGDVLDTLPDFSGSIDAWFLDGFAPSKNPDMWQPELFDVMAQNSHNQTTYATFTAARIVRDNLTRAGFTVEKIPGYAKKREMLRGQFQLSAPAPQIRSEWQLPPAPTVKHKQAVVIGGGLAGTSTARSLADRGWQVTLLDQHQQLAMEASGNPQGILYAKLSPHHTPLSRFIQQGYLYSINRLNQLHKTDTAGWHQTGVIQLPVSAAEQKRYLALAEQFPEEFLYAASADELSRLSSFTLNNNGLVFPDAGWVRPAWFCQTMANHPAIRIKTDCRITELDKDDSEWLALDKEGKEIIRSEVVVVAGGIHSHNLSQLDYLPTRSIRGQITEVSATTASKKLSSCVCSEGYIAPASDTEHTLGATFDFNDNCPSVREADHQRNLSMLSSQMPDISLALGAENISITGGRTAFRCSTPDYLPVVGPVVHRERFLEQFARLRKNAKTPIDCQPDYHQGLYVNTGHGSRGLITCPLSGEIIAAMICGDSNVVGHSLLQAINPTRFLIRGLIRNEI